PLDPALKGPLGPLVYPVPFPRHLPRPSRARLAARAAQTAGVFTGTLGGAGLRKAVGKADNLVFAQAMRRAFESLGATYLKLGQIVASSPGMFGEAIATEFRTCLDTGPAVPFDQVRRAVENDLCR